MNAEKIITQILEKALCAYPNFGDIKITQMTYETPGMSTTFNKSGLLKNIPPIPQHFSRNKKNIYVYTKVSNGLIHSFNADELNHI